MSSLRVIPVLAVTLLSLPQEAYAQSLAVGNCTASTASFVDTETVCVSGTTGGDPDSDPALACVLPSTGGTAADDVTPGGCTEFAPETTLVDEPVWLPPTDPGSYIVVLFASDETVHSQPIFISSSTGNTAPTAMPQSVSTAEDTALPITLSGTDPESDPLTFTVITGPTNGTLSGTAPNLTYTPDPNFNGADSFTFTASDGSLTSAAATISITVNPANDAPTATAQSVSTAEDTALPITLTGTDPESDPLTFTVVSGPDNGTLTGIAPNLNYTPDANFSGVDSFTFTASDGSLTSAAATISITVTAGNDAPTAIAQSVSTAEDTALPITLTGTDPESDPLTFAVVSGPGNGTLTGTAPNLTYTPDANFSGADSFTFTASDASLTSAAATISITVTAGNDAPTATAQSVSTTEDTALPITLTGTDPESDPLTFAVVSGPGNGTLTGTVPNLTYTPDPNFNGADNFTFTASDGSLTSAAATISITVTASNDAPTASAQSVSTTEDTALPITLTGTDPDSDPLTFTVVTQPGNGALTGTAPNLTYTPDPNFNGADSFTFTASDGSLTSAAATISITVTSDNDAPTATAQSVSTAEDTALPITLTGTDPESDPLTFAVVSGPGNGTLTGTAPNLTYTPDPNFNGADSFTFTASDGSLTSAAATISITVTSGNDAPTATAQSVSTTEDTALPITLTGTDPESDPLTFTVVSGPGNGTLTGTAPNLAYTPDPNFSGVDSFTFTASDGSLTSPAATISITVTAGNDAPTATAQSVSTAEDTALPITLTGTDPDSDPLTFTVVTQPGNGTLSGTAPNLTYTPDPNFSGADSFTFTASDGSLTSAAATISITVNPANDAPTATAQSVSTTEDIALPITLTGTDPESDPLTFAVVSGPGNGTLTGTVPNLTYTPNANFSGADSFTFTASDGSLTSAAATISITVNPANDAPTATAQSVSTAEDTALPITLTGTDPESDPLTFAVVSGPGNGTLTGTAPNLTYTPDPNFNGADSFTFTASDGSLTSPAATISITVTSGNDAPTATAQSVNTAEDTALPITLTGTDPESDPLTFTVVSGPDNGTITGTVPNLTYTPDPNFSGADSFTFTASDGSLTSAAATISITVTSGNDAPTATAQLVSTAEDTALPITLTGTDPESDPLTFTVVTQPGNGALTGTAPNLTYTPDPNFNGADSFTFTASDGSLASAAATISITVNPANDAPTATAQSVSTAEDTALPITLTGTDPESDPLTFAVVSGPGNGTLTGTAPNLTYTPDANFSGADSFTFTASDASLTSAAATISITVTTGNDAPVVDTPIADQFAIEGTAFNLDVSGNFTDADNDVLVFTASGLPVSGNLSFDSATGVFSGTPRVDDARDNDPYTIVVTASDGHPGSVAAQTSFDLTISALDRANVSLDISVAPNPAMLNDELRWTLTASNANGPQVATNIELSGSFIGPGLSISTTSSCTIQAAVGQVSDFDCSMGDLPVGASETVIFTTTTNGPGDVVIFASARSADQVPIDPDIDDNSSQVAVGIAEAFSLGAVQVLGSTEVHSLAAGDVDGDGVFDLIAGTAAGQPMQVYLSGGFRDFAETAIFLPDNSANEGVAVADFDGNGTLDLVVANGGGQADVVYSNDGAGNFTPMATLAPSFSQDVAAGDFNDDGFLDIVFATTQGNPVYLGDGNGGFTLCVTLGNANSHSVVVATLNNDALDDLVFANTGSDSQVWIKNAGAGFTQGDSLAIGDAVAVAIGEFGGDPSPDLAFGRVSSVAGDLPANPVLINDGIGGFGAPAAMLGLSSTNDIHAGDVNRDGSTDLVFINASGVHQIWTATGSGFDLHREQIVDADATVGIVAELGMTDVGDTGGVDLAMGGAVASGAGIFLNDGFGNLGFGDAVPPVLALVGQSSVSIQSGNAYSDAGATAQDNIDGDISASIVVTGAVNVAVAGSYTITYNVADRAGNNATPITRTVTVTSAAPTGGGGGGALSPLALLLLAISACLNACHANRARTRRRR